MSVITKEFIQKAFELEKKRREPPLNEKGFSKNFEASHKEYVNYLIKHGYLILQELEKHIS